MQGFSEVNEDLDNNKESDYYVQKIINYQLINNQWKYKVQQEGYEDWDTTWEPLEHIIFNKDKIESFYQENSKDPNNYSLETLYPQEELDAAYQWNIDRDIRPIPGSEHKNPRYLELLQLRRNSALLRGATVTVNRQKLPERDGITQNLIEPYGI